MGHRVRDAWDVCMLKTGPICAPMALAAEEGSGLHLVGEGCKQVDPGETGLGRHDREGRLGTGLVYANSRARAWAEHVIGKGVAEGPS
jgi:hypothetical protein